MNERQRTVAVLDDQPDMREALAVIADDSFKMELFGERRQFLDFVAQHPGPLVLIVDHDLGPGVIGYDIVREVRRTRLDGLLLPIIYLTGRESEAGYLTNEMNDPFASPSVYVKKTSLGSIDLAALVNSYFIMAESYGDLADGQAATRASRFFAEQLDRVTTEWDSHES